MTGRHDAIPGKSYWLIERGQLQGLPNPVWWNGSTSPNEFGDDHWTHNANLAIKYDSKAEAFWDAGNLFADPCGTLTKVCVTEHSWG